MHAAAAAGFCFVSITFKDFRIFRIIFILSVSAVLYSMLVLGSFLFGWGSMVSLFNPRAAAASLGLFDLISFIRKTNKRLGEREREREMECTRDGQWRVLV